ncbi:helix-turn-helix domain-containing protein [Pedobacter sp. UBA5917]|jgi:AraC-like DNA-binding protein|uniref:helix-turn-helix domain-containing protein n=1 Tax=Pedobacter sp. UBA5917 TaxID=1947061 RepID=UPI0025E6B04A|nr:AraC family transcriptional regulator [Pedobacter sp. UBA5917]
MSKKSAPIPIYNLGTVKQSDIHLRPLQDYAIPRPTFETSHSDSYYIFIFQQSGESKLMVDFESITLSNTCIYVIAPGQVHHFISSNHTSGWIMAAEPLTIDQTYLDILEREYGQQKPTAINKSGNNMLEACLKSLSELLSANIDGHFQHSLLSHSVSVCAGLFTSILSYKIDDKLPSRQLYLYQQFRILLRMHFINQKSPTGYAELLYVSPSYLNECIKAVSGKPLSYWIQQQMVLEAKRLLAYSKLTVKEIAYQLGYMDETYFMRLFKKSAGISPAAFRKHTVNSAAFT